MRYPVAVWVENGAYSAEVPDLPGVITEADSIEELETMVQDAASGWMECELDDGRAIPSPLVSKTIFLTKTIKIALGCLLTLICPSCPTRLNA